MKRMTRRKALAEIGSLAGVYLFSGCGINPVSGKPELMIMSEEQEIELGKQAHGHILGQYGAYRDEEMQAWFAEKGAGMASVTHRDHLPWNFTVLDSPVVNAFAVPGGYVYLTRGILGHLSSEAQFAGVLGHELGHVTARHTAAMYSKAQLMDLGLAIGSMLSIKFAVFAHLANLGTKFLFLKFSRDDERQADQLGVEYASAMGYDAVEMSDFFVTLERLSPPEGALPEWKSTHPDPGDRVRDTRRMALAYQRAHPDITFSISREEYLERIDGLVFGEDPRQGYEKDGMFYHPEMGFMFPFPKDWTMNNMASEVTFSSKDGDGLLVFTMSDEEEMKAASQAFAQANNVQVMSDRAMTVNGMACIKTFGNIIHDRGIIGVLSYYVRMDDRIYMFHGFSVAKLMNQYDRDFDTVVNGFRKIDPGTVLVETPTRIEVRRVEGATTVRKAFNDFGIDEDKIDKLALVNSLMLDDILPKGSGLKIVPEP